MKKLFGILFVFSILTGCSQYSLVNSETYNDANLSQYHTFRIVSPDQGHLPPGMQMVTYYNIAAAIREQMVERGFVEDPSSSIVINIGLTVKKELATEPLYQALPPAMAPMGPPPAPGPFYNGMYPYFIYPRPYYMPNMNAQVITGIYKEGVLTMDIVNMQTMQPLFSSSVATILTDDDTQFRNLKGIAQAVQVLFSKFPVPILPEYK